MKKFIKLILFLSVSIVGFGQSFDSFMQNVEQNNPALIALHKWLEAEETKVKTGIYPDNPAISYNYLWGNPVAIGNQQELEVSQSFKLPGYYTSKADVQKLNFRQMQALAEKEKREIMHSARVAWLSLARLKRQEDLSNSRSKDAEKLVAIMREGFEAGEITKPAFDKAIIYSLGNQTEGQKIRSEIEVQTLYLLQLNGNILLEGLTFDYPSGWEVPALDELLGNLAENSPELLMVQIGAQNAENEVKHQFMSGLPSFEAGYKSETILDQKLQGFHAGISIPLWQNRNNLTHAKLHAEWSKASQLQHESELRVQVSALYHELMSFKTSYEQMKLILGEPGILKNNLELLRTGHITFIEYLLETNLIREAENQFLQTEFAYYELLSKLKTYDQKE